MGQIVVNKNVVGEVNNQKTCLSSEILIANCILIANGAKTITIKPSTKKAILITDNDGNASFIEVPDGDAGKNKLLATNANSDLIWIDQEEGGN